MKRAMVVLVVLGVAALVALAIRLSPIRHHWYTDADTIREAVATAEIREILWQPPRRVPGTLRTDADEYEPKLSADGLTMFFVRGQAGAGAAIHTSRFDVNTGWSDPERLSEAGLESDELGPEPSADGTSLYFYSNREGGFGGYDLWVRRRVADQWGEANNLGPAVNTPFNDYGPGLAPDGKTIFFASNRPPSNEDRGPDPNAWPATIREDLFHRTYDLYAARVTESGVMEASPVTALNTPFNEGAPAVSGFGDFLYFASDRPGGAGGFDLYRARRVVAELRPAENLGAVLNTPANELDPALGLGGFRLYFSSDRGHDDATNWPRASADDAARRDGNSRINGAIEEPTEGGSRGLKPAALGADTHRTYDIFVSTSREVFRVVESERRPPLDWAAFLDDVGIPLLWLLLALVALLALLALMRGMRERRMSLLARCLLASLLAHLALMVLLTLWNVGTAVMEGVRRGGSIRVALASPSTMDGLHAQVRGVPTELESPADPPTHRPKREAAPLNAGTPLTAIAPRESNRMAAISAIDLPEPADAPAPKGLAGQVPPTPSPVDEPRRSTDWNMPASAAPVAIAEPVDPRPKAEPARIKRSAFHDPATLEPSAVRAMEPPSLVNARLDEPTVMPLDVESAAGESLLVPAVSVARSLAPVGNTRPNESQDVSLPPSESPAAMADGATDPRPRPDSTRPVRSARIELALDSGSFAPRLVEPVRHDASVSVASKVEAMDGVSEAAALSMGMSAPVAHVPTRNLELVADRLPLSSLPRVELHRQEGMNEEPIRVPDAGASSVRRAAIDLALSDRTVASKPVAPVETAVREEPRDSMELDGFSRSHYGSHVTSIRAHAPEPTPVALDSRSPSIGRASLPELTPFEVENKPTDSKDATATLVFRPDVATRSSVSREISPPSLPERRRFDLAPLAERHDSAPGGAAWTKETEVPPTAPPLRLSPARSLPAEAAPPERTSLSGLALPRNEEAATKARARNADRRNSDRARRRDGAGEAGQGWIFGRVVDAVDGDALTNAEVRLERADAPAIVSMTDDEGRYELKVEDVPDHFALSASMEGFVPSSVDVDRDALMASSTHIDFRLRRSTQAIVVIEESPRVHHLGDDRFDGPINSQFQQSSEGTVFTAEFELTSEQAPPNIRRAELTLMVKGVQRRHSIVVNGTRLSRRLDHAPEDGSFGEFRVTFDAALLNPGPNSIDIVAAPSDSDVDDFEFVNLQVHLTP